MDSPSKIIRKELVGDFLKAAREAAGLTQLELAKELCYTSPQFISNWERGIAMPPMQALPELAKVLRITPRAMLDVLYKYQEAFLLIEKEKIEKFFRQRFRAAYV